MNKVINSVLLILSLFVTSTITLTYARYVNNVQGIAGENAFLGTFYTGTTISIVGDSADTLATIYDDETFFSQDTKYRWTNWSDDDSKRGTTVSMTLGWEEPIVLDQVMMYFFIDHKGCDFPELISLSYYNFTTDSYIEITSDDYSMTTNYTDTYRLGSDGFRYIEFEGSNSYTKIDHNYTGVCPYHSYVFKNEISTTAFRFSLKGSTTKTIEGKSGFFVGLTELQLYNNGTLLNIEP